MKSFLKTLNIPLKIRLHQNTGKPRYNEDPRIKSLKKIKNFKVLKSQKSMQSVQSLIVDKFQFLNGIFFFYPKLIFTIELEVDGHTLWKCFAFEKWLTKIWTLFE